MTDEHSPKSLSFDDVNEFVHEPDQHFEHLQWLCLSLATALEKSHALVEAWRPQLQAILDCDPTAPIACLRAKTKYLLALEQAATAEAEKGTP